MPDGVTVHALLARAVSELAAESAARGEAGWAEAVLSVEDPAFFSVVQAPAAATAMATRAIVRTVISAG
jgi:hypothetical protein